MLGTRRSCLLSRTSRSLLRFYTLKGTRTPGGRPENDAIKLVRQLDICEWLPSHAIENIFLLNWCVVKSAVLKHTYDVFSSSSRQRSLGGKFLNIHQVMMHILSWLIQHDAYLRTCMMDPMPLRKTCSGIQLFA